VLINGCKRVNNCPEAIIPPPSIETICTINSVDPFGVKFLKIFLREGGGGNNFKVL